LRLIALTLSLQSLISTSPLLVALKYSPMFIDYLGDGGSNQLRDSSGDEGSATFIPVAWSTVLVGIFASGVDG
jgi:hypothetical protein